MIRVLKYFVVLITFCVVFSGCFSENKLTLDYTPTTPLALDGKVAVNNFRYLPKKKGVTQKQIPNTALGNGLFLDVPVGVYYANAVRREFSQADLSIKTGSCYLDGRINELLIDDLGFSVDLITDVTYTLCDKENRILIDNTYKTELNNLSSFVASSELLLSLNMVLSKNIESFMADPKFSQFLKERCR